MSKFKSGDKVICIDAYTSSELVVGRKYTVKSHEYSLVTLKELDGPCYYPHMFELLVESKGEVVTKPTFKRGDKVICVDSSCSNGRLLAGKEYTINVCIRPETNKRGV